jgi:hypothetical protein
MHDSIDDTASGRIMGGKGKSGLKTQLTILSSNVGFASVLAAHHILAHITVLIVASPLAEALHFISSSAYPCAHHRLLIVVSPLAEALSFEKAVLASTYPRMLQPARVLRHRHEGTKKALIAQGLKWWRWRESNPRPSCFLTWHLHA